MEPAQISSVSRCVRMHSRNVMPSISTLNPVHAVDTTSRQERRHVGIHIPAATAFMSSAKVLTSKYEIIASKALQCNQLFYAQLLQMFEAEIKTMLKTCFSSKIKYFTCQWL